MPKSAFRERIELVVKPHHENRPTLIGKARGPHAGMLVHGHYQTEYQLPKGDSLRIIANHHQRFPQIILRTRNAELVRCLPGRRESSLVANAIAHINAYCLRSDHYAEERTPLQLQKYAIAKRAVERLQKLLPRERAIAPFHFRAQEALRRKVIRVIEKARDANILLANHPTVSEGELRDILYSARQNAQQFTFNVQQRVTRADQMDFEEREQRTIIWDSNSHIGQNRAALEDALRVIISTYNLNPSPSLKKIPANRFERFAQYFVTLWENAREWADYHAKPQKPEQSHTSVDKDTWREEYVHPWFKLHGHSQQTYDSLEALAHALGGTRPLLFERREQACSAVNYGCDGDWGMLPGERAFLLRVNNTVKRFAFGELPQGRVFLLPDGEDLLELASLSEKHLYLFERIRLRIKAIITQIPVAMRRLYTILRDYVMHDLHNAFEAHVEAGHPKLEPEPAPPPAPNLEHLQTILREQGILSPTETLEDFAKNALKNYRVARPDHPGMHARYTNPAHRMFGVFRHFSDFFVDTSERNPVIGTLAMAVYFYGAGAIMAPKALTALLTKLQLHGLIKAIGPTQDMARWMSHGTLSEAISAAMTYWQGVIMVGSIDEFITGAITLIKDDPVEVAMVVSLALSMGKGICTAIPRFEDEMGSFPWINYFFLGVKGGAAIYDTIMHPGEDWLLGTLRWLLRGGLIAAELFIAPFVEWKRHGFANGFLSGWLKSFGLFLQTLKQIVHAGFDLLLAICTIPFREISAMALHVPFRGITAVLTMSLGALGNLREIGNTLDYFANRPGSWNYFEGFHPSRLYGFVNPMERLPGHPVLKVLTFIPMLLVSPVFDVFKNLFILPLVDTGSLTVRLLLTLKNPLARFIAYTAGALLKASGFLWDSSAGFLLRHLADGITLTANAVDGLAGKARQWVLSEIEAIRSMLYYQAFVQSAIEVTPEAARHLETPQALWQLPEESSHGLVQKMLGTECRTPTLQAENPLHHTFLRTDEDDDEVKVTSPRMDERLQPA